MEASSDGGARGPWVFLGMDEVNDGLNEVVRRVWESLVKRTREIRLGIVELVRGLNAAFFVLNQLQT